MGQTKVKIHFKANNTDIKVKKMNYEGIIGWLQRVKPPVTLVVLKTIKLWMEAGLNHP